MTDESIDKRPANCRFRLLDEGKPYPRSGCAACGKTIITGLGSKCEMTDENELVEHVAAIEELISILEAETGVDGNCADEPDNESVGWNNDGPLPTTFGHIRRARKELERLKSLSPGDRLPGGLVVVPYEPTEAMVQRARQSLNQELHECVWVSEHEVIAAFQDMLDADKE